MNPNPNGSPNRDVIELWGREFNVVKNGLSEAQVVSFVNDLAKQHDVLLQRQEHLVALTKLAERTVSEADKLAQEMKDESEAQAKEEAQRILAEAEASATEASERTLSEAQVKADEIIRERVAEAMAAANEKADSIKAEAESLADEAMKEAENQAKRIVSDAETSGQHILEQKEAEAVAIAREQSEAILAQARQEASTMLERERERIQPELTGFVRRLRGQLLSELEDLKHQVGALEPQFEPESVNRPTPEAVPEPSLPVPSAAEVEQEDDFMDLMSSSQPSDPGEPEWEIEIVPPIDIMKIMSIVGYLDTLPEVVSTEIIPRNDRTSIMVYVHSSLELVELVRSLPEVAHADEIGAEDERPRKMGLSLSTGDGASDGFAGIDDVLHDATT